MIQAACASESTHPIRVLAVGGRGVRFVKTAQQPARHVQTVNPVTDEATGNRADRRLATIWWGAHYTVK